MAVPKHQLKNLEADLTGREYWVRSIQRHIFALQDEVAAHQTVIALGRDPSVLRMLDELNDHPETGARIDQDPGSFFSERGVNLPDGAVVTVISRPENPAIEIRMHMDTFDYGFGWSRQKGFFMVSIQLASEFNTGPQQHPENGRE
jgi:hypothetical protein